MVKMMALGTPTSPWPSPKVFTRKSVDQNSTNHQTQSVSAFAPTIVQVRWSFSSSPQLPSSAAFLATFTGSSGRVPKIQKPSQTKPSAPVTTKADCQPKASASGGISSGVRMAPMLGAVLTRPKPRLRWVSGR